MGGFGIRELLIILLVVVVLFGTKKLRSIGSDLGGAIRGFKKAVDASETSDGELRIPVGSSICAPTSARSSSAPGDTSP